MQTVNGTMSDILVPCKNCHDLQYQLSETKYYIARLTKSELWKIAFYRKQFNQEERKYETNLQEIAADRQKIYEDQTAQKLEIAEQSLVHEFKCHRYTEEILRDTQKALAYEQERNTKLFAIIQKHYHPHRPLTASELDKHLQALMDALQHTLKELKEGEGGGDDGNRELNVE
jgi:hypothetical protein